MGIRWADHVTPLYPQKLALTSPTGGGRSVGIVRSRTKATEYSISGNKITFSFLVAINLKYSATEFKQHEIKFNKKKHVLTMCKFIIFIHN